MPRAPRRRPEVSETPVEALETNPRTNQVDFLQPPPCRFVPLTMHREGKSGPKRANYPAFGAGLTPPSPPPKA